MQRCLPVAVGMILVLTTPSGFAQETKNPKPITEPPRISLWDNDAPVGEDKREASDAWISVHRPTESNGSAVVICPGGGYGGLVTGAEGHGIAAWLNRHGITGIVLEYRLPKGRSMVPLLDAQRALRMARNRSAEWSLDPKRIGIIGFSAGGHLASTAGTHFDLGNPNASDPVERLSCRPDFMVLIYPVIMFNEKTHRGSMKNLLGDNPTQEQMDWFSSEKQVTPGTPPTFLAHALNDRVVSSDHSKAFFDALQAKGIASRYLELPTGDHGLNGYQGPMWDAWQKESLEWLATLKVSPRTAE
jgi:acetyl esterase/lipase